VGTPEFLTEYFSRDNHIVHPLSAVQCQQQTVSSSKIRQFLQNGQIHEANTFLGRPFFNQGRVATGLKIGRTLGFPTANLTDIHTLMPKSGVYSTVSLVEEKWFASVTHIGVRPTLGTRPKGMESHFIGYPSGATCYDKTVTTLFFNRLREERRFPDGQALRDQIAQDLALRQQTAEDDLRWGQEALKGPLTTHGESILDNYAPDQPLC
jgi:riboflavin kinase/FMN adenylyltransferase